MRELFSTITTTVLLYRERFGNPARSGMFFVTEVNKKKHSLELERASSKPPLNVLSEAVF